MFPRHVPVVTVVVDEPDRAQRWLALMSEIAGSNGLVTSEFVPDIRVAKGNRVSAIE